MSSHQAIVTADSSPVRGAPREAPSRSASAIMQGALDDIATHSSDPSIAVGVAYEPGATVPGVAVGTAVGAPVQRQTSGAKSFSQEPASASAAVDEVASGFLYSPLSAKFFARFDLDKNNSIDKAELRKALDSLGLTDVDAAECMKGFGTERGFITLQNWEAGLTPQMRAGIEAALDAEVPPS